MSFLDSLMLGVVSMIPLSLYLEPPTYAGLVFAYFEASITAVDTINSRAWPEEVEQ